MAFTKPVIGPKVYTTRGPSGYIETFKREDADDSLRQILGRTPLKVLAEGYIRRQAKEGGESWDSLISYLAEMAGLDEDLIPLDAAVAFWAHIGFTHEAKKADRGN